MRPVSTQPRLNCRPEPGNPCWVMGSEAQAKGPAPRAVVPGVPGPGAESCPLESEPSSQRSIQGRQKPALASCPPCCVPGPWVGPPVLCTQTTPPPRVRRATGQAEPSLTLPPLPTTCTFMIPFQLSPVETWKSVRKAMPKFSKVACLLMPSQGFSSLQTGRRVGSAWPAAESPAGPALRCCLSASSQTTSEACAGCARPQMERLRLREVARWWRLKFR